MNFVRRWPVAVLIVWVAGCAVGPPSSAAEPGAASSAPASTASPPAINSAADEYHPSLTPDGATLYFGKRGTDGDLYETPWSGAGTGG